MFLAAHLRAAGHDVFFCVRRPPEAVRVEGFQPFDIPYFLDSPPSADLALLTVKAQDTPSAMSWLETLCSAGQPVAVIQNGVHHEQRVVPYPAIPVLSYVYVEPQNGWLRAFQPPRAHFTVPAGGGSVAFRQLFAGTALAVFEEPDFHTAAWRKMLHNCVSNPLTALTGRGLEILAEPHYRDWAQRILAEALPVAQADGARLADEEGARVLEMLGSYPPGTRTSMLQDRERGRPLEIEALNGMVVALGRRYGLPVAVNAELVALLDPVINVAVAEKVAALKTVDYLRERAKRGNPEYTLAWLKSVGQDVPPAVGDELE